MSGVNRVAAYCEGIIAGLELRHCNQGIQGTMENDCNCCERHVRAPVQVLRTCVRSNNRPSPFFLLCRNPFFSAGETTSTCEQGTFRRFRLLQMNTALQVSTKMRNLIQQKLYKQSSRPRARQLWSACSRHQSRLPKEMSSRCLETT